MEVEEVSGHGLVRKKIRFLNSLILFMENSFLADPTHANDFLSFLSLPVSFSQLCAKLCRSVLLFYAIWRGQMIVHALILRLGTRVIITDEK
ncbi:hypothetical protein POTOM_038038 [Populus tomentosa]|uniref:Uncharacterized protein n=1 Tax=Populus tomentosa TaxID=118781 RepID=A0A8X8CD45_POPTO|nr:hypothetical protein POTOM_038038 [Populus tomentosa]